MMTKEKKISERSCLKIGFKNCLLCIKYCIHTIILFLLITHRSFPLEHGEASQTSRHGSPCIDWWFGCYHGPWGEGTLQSRSSCACAYPWNSHYHTWNQRESKCLNHEQRAMEIDNVLHCIWLRFPINMLYLLNWEPRRFYFLMNFCSKNVDLFQACQLPLFEYLVEKMCALCYERAWYAKLGG